MPNDTKSIQIDLDKIERRALRMQDLLRYATCEAREEFLKFADPEETLALIARLRKLESEYGTLFRLKAAWDE